MNKKNKESIPENNSNFQNTTTVQDPALHVEFGRIKAKAKNFWIAIAFIIALTIRIYYLVDLQYYKAYNKSIF